MILGLVKECGFVPVQTVEEAIEKAFAIVSNNASIFEVNALVLTKAKELEEIGYSIAIFAISGILTVAGALNRLMADIQSSGNTDKSFTDMMTYNKLNELVGIEHYHQMWDRFL